MTSLVEVEWYELWNGEEKGMTCGQWSFRDFLVMRENMFIIKLICLFLVFEVNIRYK